jgi:hypothetical protein
MDGTGGGSTEPGPKTRSGKLHPICRAACSRSGRITRHSENGWISCCFGPNLWLAERLLYAGYHDEVLTFMEGLRPYWTKDQGQLDTFITSLKTKKTTSLAPNSVLSFQYKFWN